MGADIYLESIWRPFAERLDREPNPPAVESVEDAMARVDHLFAYMMSSGGYFRNAYNQSDIMPAMGLSWSRTVRPMLDATGYLPIDKAQELLALIEERPITKATYAKHYVQIRAGMHGNPVQKWMEANGLAQPPAPQDCAPLDEFLNHAIERRDRLIGLLRKSIELNEPLLCSL